MSLFFASEAVTVGVTKSPPPCLCCPLQALSLPALGQLARENLSLLTSLTSLSFGAAGSGAIGAGLLPLKDSLVDLRVSLHHERDHFLVLHPAVEWGCLAQLYRLTALQVCACWCVLQLSGCRGGMVHHGGISCFGLLDMEKVGQRGWLLVVLSGFEPSGMAAPAGGMALR